MNNFLNGLTNATNFTLTENGGLAHKTTKSMVLDMFATGAAYRKRSDEDCILLFKNAYAEHPMYALKCLFYIRDAREGQGERRYFRTVVKWLANCHTEAVRRNMKHIPEFGRWDDLFCLFDTPLEAEMLAFVREQLALDVQCKSPSLLAKWLPSENTSSAKTRAMASKVRAYMGWSHKQYRKTLSILRARINVLERLMSAGRWDEIEFDKIPSKAGFKYRNAFARRDIIKAKYEAFAKDATTKVNAEVLNPVDIANEIYKYNYWSKPNSVQRAMFDKYWTNLKDYYNGREERGIAVVDVSGSMIGQPMNAAVSMGAYIAERGKGPFANHFITFSATPELVKFEGVDIYDKFMRARSAAWGMNTNIEATLNLLLNTAIQNKCSQDEVPQVLYIFSDMEFDACARAGHTRLFASATDTLFEAAKKQWAAHGYQLPRIVFWNLDSRHENIPAIGEGFSFVSGFSMNMVEQILSGEDGYSLMMKKLNTERYACIC